MKICEKIQTMPGKTLKQIITKEIKSRIIMENLNGACHEQYPKCTEQRNLLEKNRNSTML